MFETFPLNTNHNFNYALIKDAHFAAIKFYFLFSLLPEKHIQKYMWSICDHVKTSQFVVQIN